MKVVDTRQKEHTFGEVVLGGVFTYDGKIFMKVMKESNLYGLDLQSGYVYTFSTTIMVISLPNAELHLNK